MNYKPLSDNEEGIAKAIVDSAYAVSKNLGSGRLEYIYEVYFFRELGKCGLNFEHQVSFPIVYDGITFEEGLRLDVVV